jgi:predicted Rossmann fold flavoprotein
MAASCGEQVVVLEKNSRPGVKLRLSGSGQCNLTHGGSMVDFYDRYGTAQKSRFVKQIFFAQPNTSIIRFFEEAGVPLFERDDGKVFPRSLKSSDILRALTDQLEANGGHLRTGVVIDTVQKTEEGFCVQTNQGMFSAKQLAIATGGISYPKTGSTGDGYRWGEQFGHRIVPPRPALTPVIVERYPFAAASGVSLENVPIDLYRGGKKIRQRYGDVLLTHRGLSGPGILDLSRFLEPQDVLRLPIFRSASISKLESLLCGKKLLKNALAPLGIPDRLLQLLLLELGISPETSAAEVNRECRHRLKNALEAFPFIVKHLGDFGEAMATSGGIALEKVNRRTMESRLVPGLFFCGEVLDIDGDTGGYNIQFALSSGFVAGESAAQAIC